MKISSLDKCSGCGICSYVCPHNCISMSEDAIGHLYPVVDENNCSSCGLCQKMCHQNKDNQIFSARKAFACWSNDIKIRKKSTSGGIATVISHSFVNSGFSVYGSALEAGKISHIRVDDVSDIHRLQGSKYVESSLIEVIPQIEKDLRLGKAVVFFGTPCQCSSVEVLFKKYRNNLYLVELICTGVPPQRLLWEHIGTNEISDIRFRDSIGTQLTVFKSDRMIYQKPVWKDLFLMGFSTHLYFRDSCYNCKYASLNRCSDITIGDFWGIGKDFTGRNDVSPGLSLALINSDKGEAIFKRIANDIFYEERNVEEAISGNPRYYSPSEKHKNSDLFREIYKKKGFKIAIKCSLRKERFSYFMYTIKRAIKDAFLKLKNRNSI